MGCRKKCNLNCKHCRSSKQIRDNDLSLYEYIEIIHKLKNWGVEKIVFTEKEPFFNPNIIEIIKECKKVGIKCSAVTNGTLLSKNLIKELEKQGFCELFISLEGWNKEDNDYVRGIGTFDKVVDILNFFQSMKILIHLSIQLDITDINYIKIEEFLEFFNQFPDISIICSIIAPIGNAEDNQELLINNRNYNYFKSEILKKIKEKKIFNDVFFSFGSPFNNIYYNLINLSNEEICFSDCDINDNGFTIQPNGDIVKCSALIGTNLEIKYDNYLGNINDYSSPIKYKSPVKVSYKEEEICINCIFKNSCCLCYIMQENLILEVYKEDCEVHIKKIISLLLLILQNKKKFKINENVFIEIRNNKYSLYRCYNSTINHIKLSNKLIRKVVYLLNKKYMYLNDANFLYISDIMILVFNDLLVVENDGSII